MAKLFQLVTREAIGWTILLFAIGLGSSLAAESCSLIVQVIDPNNNMVSGVSVMLHEGNGRVDVSSTSDRGEAQFCDLGIRAVTVIVGSSSCNQVTVSKVPLVWAVTRTVKVSYDRAACLLDEPPPILPCSILLRFADKNGKWIPGVGFKPAQNRAPLIRSDVYGRIMVRMERGEILQTATEKAGYLPHSIDIACSTGLTDRELIVTLQIL